MEARLVIGNAAYAVIKTDTIYMDIRLEPGRSAAQSLRETASEWDAKAKRLMRDAQLARQAAEILA